jgi:site-specific DNA-cytosine methylase
MPTVLNLFSGMGLSSAGFRHAGWDVVEVELNPTVLHLSEVYHKQFTNPPILHILGNALEITDDQLNQFDAIWCSPPCQSRSPANQTGNVENPEFAQDLLEWSLNLVKRFPQKTIWVENVLGRSKKDNQWGEIYNAHQFGTDQNRNRIIGGNYPKPEILKPYQKVYSGICPTVTATEYKGCASDTRRASRFYGRRITLQEAAYHMDIFNPTDTIRDLEKAMLPGYTPGRWRQEIYRGLGNGVPVKMAAAFAKAAYEKF